MHVENFPSPCKTVGGYRRYCNSWENCCSYVVSSCGPFWIVPSIFFKAAIGKSVQMLRVVLGQKHNTTIQQVVKTTAVGQFVQMLRVVLGQKYNIMIQHVAKIKK